MSIWETTIDWDALPDARENTYAWDSLGELRQHNSIADANNLDESTERARKGTSWKYSVQAFCWFRLRRITALQQALDALEADLPGGWEPHDGAEFFQNERGRVRPITAQTVDDRVLSHCLNDFELIPKIRPYLIHDNGASLKGKGLAFSRQRRGTTGGKARTRAGSTWKTRPNTTTISRMARPTKRWPHLQITNWPGRSSGKA